MAKPRSHQTKLKLGQLPKWVEMLIDELRLDPEIFHIEIETPVTVSPTIITVHAVKTPEMRHTGQVIIHIEGWKKK